MHPPPPGHRSRPGAPPPRCPRQPAAAARRPGVRRGPPALAAGGDAQRGVLLLPVDTYDPCPSSHAPPRRVDVLLPPGYHDPAHSGRRHPVVYFADGQNGCWPHLSFSGASWGVDAAVAQLARGPAALPCPPPICVLVWNTGQQRRQEYMPAAAVRWLTSKQECWFDSLEPDFYHPTSDAYLDMLLQDVKPLVDDRYRTAPDAESTFLVGSSMGGLVSLYGLIRHPEAFGGAACLSTHWVPGNGLVVGWLAAGHVPRPRPYHRLYFDHGDRGLDAGYAPLQRRVDQLMGAAGWVQGRNYSSAAHPGEGHHEGAWRRRLPGALRFLLTGRDGGDDPPSGGPPTMDPPLGPIRDD